MLLFSVSMNDSSFSENPWRRRVESEPSAVSNWEKIPAVVLPTSSFTLLLYSLHLLSLFWLPPPLSDMMNPLNCVLYLQAGVIFKLFQLFHTFHHQQNRQDRDHSGGEWAASLLCSLSLRLCCFQFLWNSKPWKNNMFLSWHLYNTVLFKE